MNRSARISAHGVSVFMCFAFRLLVAGPFQVENPLVYGVSYACAMVRMSVCVCMYLCVGCEWFIIHRVYAQCVPIGKMADNKSNMLSAFSNELAVFPLMGGVYFHRCHVISWFSQDPIESCTAAMSAAEYGLYVNLAISFPVTCHTMRKRDSCTIKTFAENFERYSSKFVTSSKLAVCICMVVTARNGFETV